MWTTAERATTISLSPPSAPRLRLQPVAAPGSARTALDGAWWPRSADPVAELPGLILALQAHTSTDPNRVVHSPIAHILLRITDWDSRPRRLRVDSPSDSRVVRLSWFDTLPAGLLTAIWADGRRIDLLTIPSGTGPAAAAALDLAAHPANHLNAPELLAALIAPTGLAAPADSTTATESAWESEGGRLRETPDATRAEPRPDRSGSIPTRDRRSP